MTVGLGNLFIAVWLFGLSIVTATDGHPIIAFASLVVAVIGIRGAFDDGPPPPPTPPQHPLYG